MTTTHPGIVFKEFRQNKGFSAKEVAGDSITPQFLNKFERGVSDIRFSTLMELLVKINVTVDEFMQRMEQTLDRWIQQNEHAIDQAYLTGNSSALNQLIVENEQRYEETGQARYRLVAIIAQHEYNVCLAHLYTLDVAFVQNYLRQIDDWGKFELFIITYLASLFEPAESLVYARQILKRLDEDYHTNRWRCDAFLHIFYQAVVRGDLEMAESLWTQYKKLYVPERKLGYLHYDLYGKFVYGLLLIARGDNEGMDQCQRIIQVFRDDGGYASYANRLHVLMQKFQLAGRNS